VSDTLDDAHAQAGLALLRADIVLTVYDGKVPDQVATGPGPDLPYVLVYSKVSWPRDGAGNTIQGTAVTVSATWTCHCVGASAQAARGLQGRVRAALLNQRPVIAGRSCGLIKQDEVLDPNPDESTGRLVMDAVSTYSLVTTP
jgi:hypothetical protein